MTRIDGEDNQKVSREPCPLRGTPSPHGFLAKQGPSENQPWEEYYGNRCYCLRSEPVSIYTVLSLVMILSLKASGMVPAVLKEFSLDKEIFVG
jgi:hypothetical protein